MKINPFTVVPVAVIATILGLGALVAQGPVTAAETSVAAQSDPMQFVKGAKMWADTCARCHNMRDPKSLRDDQWRAAMAHMRVRAGLTATEAENVLVFLQQSN
jgi:cytochrome c553